MTLVLMNVAILRSCNINVVQQALHELGAENVDAVDKNDCTALMIASERGDIESVKYLHEIKADLKVCGASGTAMHCAALGGHTEILKVDLNQ